ncbi:hypothetical protein ACP70R_030274 [Stipagrostis hirtigluma subsp. patula]
MPGQRTPAAPLGVATSRRHAELLLRSGVGGGGGGSVKDLRLHRVVPPASPSVVTTPECAAATEKPGSVKTTPPEAVAAVAPAVEDLERKPALPRSKLVRDPGSFGYRRLLPFLNEMAKNDGTNGKEMPSENSIANPKRELHRSYLRLVDESLDGSPRESDPMDSVEPVVGDARGDHETKDGCIREEINTAPRDLASSKPWLNQCVRSRIVHRPSSFSYKRMLPFLMENDISSQDGNRIKIRRIAEERQLALDENNVLASGEHLAVTEDSSKECNRAQTEVVEEKLSKEDGNDVLDGRQVQPADSRASPPECSTAELQNITHEEASASTSNEHPNEGTLISDGNDVMADGRHMLAVSEDSREECNSVGDQTSVQDKTLKSDGSCVLDGRKFQPVVSEVSTMEDSSAEVQKSTQEQPFISDGDKEILLTSDKGELLAKEQPQPCVAKEVLTAQLGDNAEFAEVPLCQSSDSGCHDAGFGTPAKTVIPLLHQDTVASLDDPLLIGMIHRPSDPCAIDRSLSEEEMSGCPPLTESGSNKAGILRPRGAHFMEKRGLSPKKLSPRKGILKRHTRGCKGVCMCLDCTTFRLRADRAFEFSRKQMQEADDIIGNLLKEVANLRSLLEKPTDQDLTQAACRRASRVEEVARERCQQMFLDLNSHCRIPGPKVRFTQYVEEKEKAASSPCSKNRR